MKYTLIITCLLSISCASVQCMNGTEQQQLIDGQLSSYNTSNSAANASNSTVFIDLEQASINGAGRGNGGSITVVGAPRAEDAYGSNNGDITTFAQFWKAYEIPITERWRSRALLDQYVVNRHNREKTEICCKCCSYTLWCLCGAGVTAGLVTGFVYLIQWEPACDDPNWYNPDCNYTISNNVTQLIKSKME